MIVVALVGQPNVGKSSLINSISNSTLKVGNFSGVTVEKSEVIFEYKGEEIKIVDLPGSYSLDEYTIDEKVTKDFLLNEEYDLILNVLDSTHLERNLYLTSELMKLNKKMIIALNMIDEAEKEGICIDEKQLKTLLNIPSIKVSAKTKDGIKTLLETIVNVKNRDFKKQKLIFSEVIEEEIRNIVSFLDEKKHPHSDYRTLAIELLEAKESSYRKLHDKPIWLELEPILRDALEHIYIHYDIKDLKEIFAIERVSFSSGVAEEVKSCDHLNKKKDLTKKIDSILIHKIFGIPIFLFMMWSLFQLTFEIGSIPMEYIDMLFADFGAFVAPNISHDSLRSLIVDGIIAGVGAVVLFLPNIIILFLGIALLETTGYMSRVAFLLDGFFHKFGLHGKSFIPLVTGFGCSVPAYMSARTLKNERDRLLTLFIIGFMSCGAKLPVYVLFVGAFFDEAYAGNILFAIYLFGAILGLLFAKILKLVVFKAEDEPFVMEMPKYRLPTFKLIWHTVTSKALMYLKKAGTFILLATVLIWFASNYPKNISLEESYGAKIELAESAELKSSLENELNQKLLEESYLGIIGKACEPIFEPIGFDWKMTVALQTGLAAKEVVVATLGVLYSLGEDVDEESSSLIDEIRKNISFASAVSFIIFLMVYLPCLAASIVFTKEAGGYKYLAYLFIFTTVSAYILSFIAYRTTLLIG
jgi:ferrous iron transport protein B